MTTNQWSNTWHRSSLQYSIGVGLGALLNVCPIILANNTVYHHWAQTLDLVYQTTVSQQYAEYATVLKTYETASNFVRHLQKGTTNSIKITYINYVAAFLKNKNVSFSVFITIHVIAINLYEIAVQERKQLSLTLHYICSLNSKVR